jgi:Flp pilus assembly protein TadG
MKSKLIACTKEYAMKEVVTVHRPEFLSSRVQTLGTKRTRTPGQGIVEFALALPFLMLIMLGTIDLGRMFFDYIDMRSAVVDGAQYGARNPTNTSGIVTATKETGVPANTVVTSATSGSCTTAGGTGNVTVTATSVFQPMTTGFLQRFGLGPVNLSASATMRCMT